MHVTIAIMKYQEFTPMFTTSGYKLYNKGGINNGGG